MTSPMPDLPDHLNFNWPHDHEELTTELIGGSTIDDFARAASEHGIMITISFIPANGEEEVEESS